MKNAKHAVSLVAVLMALFVASLGASFEGFTASTEGITQDTTYQVTKDGDFLIGATGLHW